MASIFCVRVLASLLVIGSARRVQTSGAELAGTNAEMVPSMLEELATEVHPPDVSPELIKMMAIPSRRAMLAGAASAAALPLAAQAKKKADDDVPDELYVPKYLLDKYDVFTGYKANPPAENPYDEKSEQNMEPWKKWKKTGDAVEITMDHVPDFKRFFINDNDKEMFISGKSSATGQEFKIKTEVENKFLDITLDFAPINGVSKKVQGKWKGDGYYFDELDTAWVISKLTNQAA
jgi:hypothetical protein